MTIRRRKDAKTYFVDIRYIDDQGNKRRLRRTTGQGTTKKEAEKMERELKAELKQKGAKVLNLLQPVTSSESSMAVNTVNEATPGKEMSPFSGFAHHWMETYVKVNNKPSEIASKKMIVKKHLHQFFGDTPLIEITQEDISRYIAAKKKAGLSPKTINNHLICMSKLFASAVEWDYLDKSPMSGIKKLKVPKKEIDFYTAEETAKFLETAKESESHWYPFFCTAFLTGMRLGELTALKRKDIDFENNVIHVRKAVWRGIEGETKSGRERMLPLHEHLKQVLLPRKGKQNDHVFQTKTGKDLITDSTRTPMNRICKKAGLRRLRFHDIRHSFASQLVCNGQPLKSVQELLGHSTIQMTEIYAHLSPDVNQDAVASLFQDKVTAEKKQEFGHGLGTVCDFQAFQGKRQKRRLRGTA